MSKARELAAKIGATTVGGDSGTDAQCWTGDVAFGAVELEAFYHAARAEALRDVLDEWHKPHEYGGGTFIERLRAMADREGK